jgi:hypothetical protein
MKDIRTRQTETMLGDGDKTALAEVTVLVKIVPSAGLESDAKQVVPRTS